MPFIQTTPRAGKFLSQHLKQLLREKCPVSLADNPTDLRVTPERLLTSAFLETIKTRLLFASPLLVNARDNIGEDEMNDNYRDMSTATEVHVEVWLEEEQSRGIMAIPGWIRERASECLFQGDEDALSLTDVILEAVSRAPSDLRRSLISSMLLVGGTAQLPNLQNRLLQEIKRAIQTVPKWKKLGGLIDSVRFLDDLTVEDRASLSTAVGFLGGGGGPSRSGSTMDLDAADLLSASGSNNNLGARETKGKSSKEKKVYQSSGKVFMPNCRTWIGGSLVGSLKVSGPELLRENFNGTVPDWSTASLTATATAAMAASGPSSTPAYSHDATPALITY
jgi:actin-related protein 10